MFVSANSNAGLSSYVSHSERIAISKTNFDNFNNSSLLYAVRIISLIKYRCLEKHPKSFSDLQYAYKYRLCFPIILRRYLGDHI